MWAEGDPSPAPRLPIRAGTSSGRQPSSLSLRLAACTLGTGAARATVHAIVLGPRALLSLWPSVGSATGGWLRLVPGSGSSPGAFLQSTTCIPAATMVAESVPRPLSPSLPAPQSQATAWPH